ncbi:MAG: dockerin type I repeat-containing protein [Acutalibacteraceae bacterium]
MKKSVLSIVLAVAMVLTMAFSAIGAQASADGIGYDFLQETYIAEGRDNVTINSDGSWTVTGNFALSIGLTYEFNVYKYLFQNFTSDVEYKVTILDRDPNGVYEDHWIGLYDNWVGPQYFPVGTYKDVNGVDGIYNWNKWGDNGKATITAIYVELNGTGTLTMKELRLSDNTAPTTTPTTLPTKTWDSSFNLVPADPSVWSSMDASGSQATVTVDGSAVKFGNTAGNWPSAITTYEPVVLVSQDDAAIKYNFTASGNTNIILFFGTSTPDSYYDNEYYSLNADIADVNPGTDISGHYEGYLYLKDLALPDGVYDELGNVKLTGIKIFAVGAASDNVVTVDELSLLYNEGTIVTTVEETTTTTEETTTTTEETTTTTEETTTTTEETTTTTEETTTTTEETTTTTLPDPQMVGDLDGDGELSIADSQLLYRYASGVITLTDAQMIVAADLNQDGVVNMIDSFILYLLVSGQLYVPM